MGVAHVSIGNEAGAGLAVAPPSLLGRRPGAVGIDRIRLVGVGQGQHQIMGLTGGEVQLQLEVVMVAVVDHDRVHGAGPAEVHPVESPTPTPVVTEPKISNPSLAEVGAQGKPDAGPCVSCSAVTRRRTVIWSGRPGRLSASRHSTTPDSVTQRLRQIKLPGS